MMTCSELRLVLEPFLTASFRRARSPSERAPRDLRVLPARTRDGTDAGSKIERDVSQRTTACPTVGADRSGSFGHPPGAFSGRPVGWRRYAAAAVLALTISGAALYGLGVYPTITLQAEVMQESSEELSTFIKSRRVVDVASNDPREVRDWMTNKVAFGPPLPPQVSGLEFVGGRLCYFLDRRIASYMYRSDDASLISLYVMERPGLDRLEGQLLALAGRKAALGEVKGSTNLIWFGNGLAYVLVSSYQSIGCFQSPRRWSAKPKPEFFPYRNRPSGLHGRRRDSG